MRIVITGGTGFVGGNLCRALLAKGHEVVAIGSRRPCRQPVGGGRFHCLTADTRYPGPWQDAVRRADVVVNLAGRTVFKRWTAAYKREIYDSRVLTTRHVVDAVKAGTVLLSTSAVGYYGDRGDDVLTEDEPPGNDFLAVVSRDWEVEALKAADKGARVAVMRFGVVLGRGGGAVERMLPAFRLFVGGPLGSGRQWMAWIHISDLLGALLFLMEDGRREGVFNLCAPHPVTSRELADTMGRLLRRPSRLPAPAFMLRAVLGEAASVLTASQRAVPHRLCDRGFAFRFARIGQALEHLIANSPETDGETHGRP